MRKSTNKKNAVEHAIDQEKKSIRKFYDFTFFLNFLLLQMSTSENEPFNVLIN